jgi:hypothetical protein
VSAAVTHPKFDPAERRAAVRRTVWIMTSIALALFVGFILHATLR